MRRSAASEAGPKHRLAAATYLDAVQRSSFMLDLVGGGLPLDWAPASLVSDDPAKVRRNVGPGAMLPQLSRVIGTPAKRVQRVSAYFVPAAAGTDAFVAMARRGVDVSVMTNALETTDVPIVHAGYAKRRKSLLEGGVKLYELSRHGRPSEKRGGLSGQVLQSSSSSLHAKTFPVDGSQVFVGSFNFDPRSMHLNTEMGVVIQSASLARQNQAAFEQATRQRAYEVRLNGDHELYWLDASGGVPLHYETEPGTSLWQRLGVRLLSLLPIEWLL